MGPAPRSRFVYPTPEGQPRQPRPSRPVMIVGRPRQNVPRRPPRRPQRRAESRRIPTRFKTPGKHSFRERGAKAWGEKSAHKTCLLFSSVVAFILGIIALGAIIYGLAGLILPEIKNSTDFTNYIVMTSLGLVCTLALIVMSIMAFTYSFQRHRRGFPIMRIESCLLWTSGIMFGASLICLVVAFLITLAFRETSQQYNEDQSVIDQLTIIGITSAFLYTVGCGFLCVALVIHNFALKDERAYRRRKREEYEAKYREREGTSPPVVEHGWEEVYGEGAAWKPKDVYEENVEAESKQRRKIIKKVKEKRKRESREFHMKQKKRRRGRGKRGQRTPHTSVETAGHTG